MFSCAVWLCVIPFAVPVMVTGNEPAAAAALAVSAHAAFPSAIDVILEVTPSGKPATVRVGETLSPCSVVAEITVDKDQDTRLPDADVFIDGS